MAQGCRELQGELRWVITGTPIINGASVGPVHFLLPTISEFRQDLSSLLSFLRVFKPLDDPEYFKRLLTRPLGRRDPTGAELLKVDKSLRSICEGLQNSLVAGPHELPISPQDEGDARQERKTTRASPTRYCHYRQSSAG